MVAQVIKKRAVKTFTPTFEGVAVEVIPQEVSEGGVIVPENQQLSASFISPVGWVVAVGPDVKHVKVGQKVIFGDAPCIQIRHAGQTLVVQAERNLVGIVDEGF